MIRLIFVWILVLILEVFVNKFVHFLLFVNLILVEQKDAVSTSHCSQSNNIEYDMALEWCLLQERVEKTWRKLYLVYNFELCR
jgi:hypothetical protein